MSRFHPCLMKLGAFFAFIFLQSVSVWAEPYVYVTNNLRIIRVDCATGNRVRVQDDSPGVEPLYTDLWGICAQDDTNDVFFVVDYRGEESRIIRVTVREEDGALYGQRELVSDQNSTGPALVDPYSLAYFNTSIFVTLPHASQILKVNVSTGERTLLCTGFDGNIDPPLIMPTDIERHQLNYLVTADQLGRSVIRIDPDTGERVLISSDERGSGPAFIAPRGIAIEPTGKILVTDGYDQNGPKFRIIRVDPHTGDRTVLSSNETGTGPVAGSNILDISALEDGQILFADPSSRDIFGSASLLEADQTTGNRAVVSGLSRGTGPYLGYSSLVYGPRFIADSAGENQFWYVDNLHGSDETGSGSKVNPWATIQHAVDTVNGTEESPQFIFVAEGIYFGSGSVVLEMDEYEHLYGGFTWPDWDRNITHNQAIIHGQNVRRCVIGANNATLDGFMIRNGLSDEYGGGLFNVSVSPTIYNCTFLGNASSTGGGIYNWKSSPDIISCTFDTNNADYGGAILNFQSNPQIRDSVFIQNSANFGGGGIDNEESSPTFENCQFTGNQTLFGGGAMENYMSSPQISKCRFENNSTFNHGGGLRNIVSSAHLQNSIFWKNTATGPDENLGGAIYNLGSEIELMNCTIAANQADGGGAIFNQGQSTSRLTNCILWNDAPDELQDVESSVIANYCDIEQLIPGTANFRRDPLFISEDTGDLRLGLGSPCVNSASRIEILPDDIENVHRPQGLFGDIGAHEMTVQITEIDRPGYIWDWLETGKMPYGDRQELFINPMTTRLFKQPYVRTLNDDRNATNFTLFHFTIDRPSTVVVAFDSRITTPPSWLESWGWTRVIGTLNTTNPESSPRVLYQKWHEPGLVTLGPNRDETSPLDYDMYSVVVLLQENAVPASVGSDWTRFK